MTDQWNSMHSPSSRASDRGDDTFFLRDHLSLMDGYSPLTPAKLLDKKRLEQAVMGSNWMTDKWKPSRNLTEDDSPPFSSWFLLAPVLEVVTAVFSYHLVNGPLPSAGT